MKIKTISLLGLIITTLISSSNVFAQTVKRILDSSNSIILDQENADRFNLNVENVRSSLEAEESDIVFINLSDDGDIINLGIYKNPEFMSSKVDRDGISH